VTVAAPLDRLRSAMARCCAVGDDDLAWLGKRGTATRALIAMVLARPAT
jgi:hypothetical protein